MFALGLLIALSSPVSLLLLPIVVLRGFRERRIPFFGMGLMAGLPVQMVVMIATHAATSVPSVSGATFWNGLVFSTLVAITNQILLFCLLGRRSTQFLLGHHYFGFTLVFLLGFVCLESAVYLRSSRKYRGQILILMYLIVGSVVLTMLRGLEPDFSHLGGLEVWGSHRYFLLGCWCFAYIVLLAVGIWKPLWPSWRQALLVVLIFLFGAIHNFHLVGYRNTTWRQSAAQIRAWETDRAAGRAHKEVVFPINPPSWTVELPALR